MNQVVEEVIIKPKKTKKLTTKKNETKPTEEVQVKESMEIANKINTNIENSPVEPLFWVLPNKKSFPQWVSETFIKYRANGKSQSSKGKSAFKFQKLLRDYMQDASPYRGILLYHKLGAGKTYSSIVIAENLKTTRNVVIMLPASLKPNFEKELLSLPEYKADPMKWKEKYSFVSYNASNTLDQIRRVGGFDNKVVIIDEVHNLVSKMVSGIYGISSQGKEIYEQLMNASNVKIVALSGTPVINDPFEIAVLMNILRGHIEVTNFRIMSVDPKYGETWDFTEFETKLANIPYVDFVEINKINKSISFHITVRSYQTQYRTTIDEIHKVCRENGIDAKFLTTENFTLFPTEEDGERFREIFIKEDSEKGDRLKPEMIPIFKSRILGLISFYQPLLTNYPDVLKQPYERVNMSEYQLAIYNILRAKERLTEKGSSKGKKGKKGKEKTKSTFRVFSRQASNFVFPPEIPRPYPDPTFVVTLKKAEENNEKQKEAFLKSALAEEELNNEGKIKEDYRNRIEIALQQLTENGEKYLRPGPEGLDSLSPKFRMVLANIQKSKGLVFVYSNFRSLEGVEIFSKVLDFNGFSRFGSNDDKPKYTLYSGTEDQEEKKKILEVFTSPENKHGEKCKILMATSAGAEGLDLKNIRQIHIMEPYWNQMRIEQVIGRGVRRGSHIDLPPEERNIEVFRYFSVMSEANALQSREKVTTDEHIEALSEKKQFVLNELLLMMQECAFDCILNAADIQGSYRCFGYGSDANGIAYFPQLRKNIEYTSRTENVKTVTKDLRVALYENKKLYYVDEKKKKMYLVRGDKKDLVDIPAAKKPVYVDNNSYVVYDYKSVKQGNPIRLGYVSSTSGITKTKKD